MKKYRSKPVEIEAIKFTEDSAQKIITQILQEFCDSYFMSGGTTLGISEINIKTFEGVMKASLGDWIIKGTEGEFYPCKDFVFQRKYELVGEAPEEKS